MMSLTRSESGLFTIHVKGRIERGNYERIVPELEEIFAQGKARTLIDLDGFKGFTPGALFEELEFE
jgi:hypothetical protein